jgi:hypothetical protein
MVSYVCVRLFLARIYAPAWRGRGSSTSIAFCGVPPPACGRSFQKACGSLARDGGARRPKGGGRGLTGILRPLDLRAHRGRIRQLLVWLGHRAQHTLGRLEGNKCIFVFEAKPDLKILIDESTWGLLDTGVSSGTSGLGEDSCFLGDWRDTSHENSHVITLLRTPDDPGNYPHNHAVTSSYSGLVTECPATCGTR